MKRMIEKNVKVKIESDTEMDETETIPYGSPKRENDIDNSDDHLCFPKKGN